MTTQFNWLLYLEVAEYLVRQRGKAITAPRSVGRIMGPFVMLEILWREFRVEPSLGGAMSTNR
jgi:hypothetical protein